MPLTEFKPKISVSDFEGKVKGTISKYKYISDDCVEMSFYEFPGKIIFLSKTLFLLIDRYFKDKNIINLESQQIELINIGNAVSVVLPIEYSYHKYIDDNWNYGSIINI